MDIISVKADLTGLWKHSKTGMLYRVTNEARLQDDNSNTRVVIYKQADRFGDVIPEGELFVRTVDDFLAMVQIQGTKKPRFAWVGESLSKYEGDDK